MWIRAHLGKLPGLAVEDSGTPIELTYEDAIAQVFPDQNQQSFIEFPVELPADLLNLIISWRDSQQFPASPTDRLAIYDFFEAQCERADVLSRHCIGILLWTCGEIWCERSYLAGMRWSEDKTTWHRFPVPTPGLPRLISRPQVQVEVAQADAQRFLSEGRKVSIGYEMLVEADRIFRNSERRSALVIAVAAVEVAVKEFIGDVVPEAAYLATHVPSPPIDKLMKYYLPTITKRNPCPPKRVMTIIKKGIEARNNVAHRGARDDELPDLAPLLSAAFDAIWLMEWSRGFERAWKYLTNETHHEYCVEHLEAALATTRVPINERQALLRAANDKSTKTFFAEKWQQLIAEYQDLPREVAMYAVPLLPK